LLEDSALAALLTAGDGGGAIPLTVVAVTMVKARVALARAPRRLRIQALEIAQYEVDGLVQAVRIEPVEPDGRSAR
jgi:hypothetical protein